MSQQLRTIKIIRTGHEQANVNDYLRPATLVNRTRSRLRKVSARRIEADCFKSWTRPDRKTPGYRVRRPWQPRRIFYRG
jgi:hypothetical protein